MASSATDAGGKEKDIRESLVKSGDVDVIISIGNNFFYTRSLPCTLWFFDKNKLEKNKDKVLMIDARNIFRKVNRTINDFSPEQLKNLTSIVWLYRGENEKYLKLIKEYIVEYSNKSEKINEKSKEFERVLQLLVDQFEEFNSFKLIGEEDKEKKAEYYESLKALEKDIDMYFVDKEKLNNEIQDYLNKVRSYRDNAFSNIEEHNSTQKDLYTGFENISKELKLNIKAIDHLYKEANNILDKAEKDLDAKKSDVWNTKAVRENRKSFEELRRKLIEFIKDINYIYSQVKWLQTKFVDAKLEDIEGLCKLVDRDTIEQNDWSLTPGRYVGVAQNIDEDFDFQGRLKEIQIELDGLNEEAFELAKIIKANFEELGI